MVYKVVHISMKYSVFQVFPSISLTRCLMIDKDNCNGSTQHKHRPRGTGRLDLVSDLVL